MVRPVTLVKTFHLPKPLCDQLDELTKAPGVFKSRIVAEALENWFERKGSSELELTFARRLDRMSRQLARLERNGHIGLESLGLFIRYMLTVTAPVAEGDKAAQALGKERFKAFLARVGRRLAEGRPTLLPDEEEEK